MGDSNFKTSCSYAPSPRFRRVAHTPCILTRWPGNDGVLLSDASSPYQKSQLRLSARDRTLPTEICCEILPSSSVSQGYTLHTIKETSASLDKT